MYLTMCTWNYTLRRVKKKTVVSTPVIYERGWGVNLVGGKERGVIIIISLLLIVGVSTYEIFAEYCYIHKYIREG